MNKFSYYITIHFITSNKDYNSCRNPHSVYQTYPYLFNFFHLSNHASFEVPMFREHPLFHRSKILDALIA